MDLFKAFKHEANLSKSGFDLSRKHVFSSQAGQALPVLSVETVPGDHFEIDMASFMRTQTMNTAAFFRGKQRFDFFFVPYSQLWHPFNQFITQRTDKHSTRQLGHLNCPVVELSDILNFIVFLNDNQVKDMFDYEVAPSVVRLLDLLGFGDFRWLLDSQASEEVINSHIGEYDGKYVNLFRIAAYQHIWYDYYRNKYWQVSEGTSVQIADNTFDFVRGFNFDDVDCSTFVSSVLGYDYDRFLSIFTLRYVQWKKDLFTSCLPAEQFGNVSTVNVFGDGILDTKVNNAFKYYNGNTAAEGTTHEVRLSDGSLLDSTSSLLVSHTHTIDARDINSSFDVLALRKAEALQAWKQNTLRGGNMTDDAFKSHFGVSPYYESDENVHYLGSFANSLDINPVTTTSNSSTGTNTRVGDLAGSGSSLIKGSKLTFDCKDYGVIMCIASFLPENEYNSFGMDKANTLYEQFDFFTPEFQNIGLEAVPLSEQTIGSGRSMSSLQRTIGYAPRYYMYKQAIDKVFGTFHISESSGIWDSDAGEYKTLSSQGGLEQWVCPRREMFGADDEHNIRSIASLYVNPRSMNNIFGINASAWQSTDYLIHNCYFDIKAIRPMTVLGLPQF